LHEAVEDFFTTAKQANFNPVAYAYHEEIDNDHGRLEIRRYWTTEELCTLPKTELWKELRSIGFVERECHIGDKVTIDQRCFTQYGTKTKTFSNSLLCRSFYQKGGKSNVVSAVLVRRH
jgi:hypothetical protein